MNKIRIKFENIGVDPKGSFNKAIAINNFNWLLVGIFIASILWSIMLYLIGQPSAAIIPLISVFVTPIILYNFYRTKNFDIALNAFLLIILVLPALVQLFNGGFINSGAVISWSAMAPIMALAFKPAFEAKRCFGFFILVITISILIEIFALPSYNIMSANIIRFQFLLNLTGVVTTCFFPLLAFTKEIKRTKNIITIRNQTIDLSFKYAKNIQTNLIPNERELNSILNLKTFVIFKPKHSVGGDFYWAHSNEFNSIIICADCTGHGVPGTLMAVTTISLLNSIIKDDNERDPMKIMTLLHNKIRDSFNKSEDIFDDTILLSICVIDKINNVINYTNSRSKIYLFNGLSLSKYRSDPFKVGDQNRDVRFSNRAIKYSKGDILYLSTKGFMNQFGERDDKKFNSSNFINSINKYGPFPFDNQKELFLKKLSKWQGNLDQTDDITLLGIEL